MNDAQAIEITLEEARKSVNKYKLMSKLYDNPEFKELIMDGYFKEEAARLATAMGMANSLPSGTGYGLTRDKVITSIEGIGSFQAFLNTIIQQGRHAEQAMEGHQACQAEIMKEGLD